MPPTPPQTPFNFRRLSKTLSFWLLVILASFACFVGLVGLCGRLR